MQVAGQLGTSVDALAALAAHLRIEAEGLEVDPPIRDLLAAIAGSVVGDTAALPPPARAALVGMTRTFLYQASDLVERPGRAAGWEDTDERLLQSIGQLSMGIVDAVAATAADRPSLAALLARPGTTFVDVGTGSGWLAIALARAYPDLRVVGLDIFEPALALARRNVADAGLDGRVELVAQDATTLEPESADVVWIPLPFLPRDVGAAVVAAAAAAVRPGGWVLPGSFPGPGDSLPEQLMTLRTLRSGGYPWPADELIAELAAAGLVDATEVPRRWPSPVRLFAAQRPIG
jgi:SAM-dependent methyltransferase